MQIRFGNMLFTTIYWIAFVPLISFYCWIKMEGNSQIHSVLLLLKSLLCNSYKQSRAEDNLSSKQRFPHTCTRFSSLILSKEYDSKTDLNIHHTEAFLTSHNSLVIYIRRSWRVHSSERKFENLIERRCIMTRLICVDIFRFEICVPGLTQTVLSSFWYYDEMHFCTVVDAYFSLTFF